MPENARPSAESAAVEWAVRAENGTTCYASEEVARAALADGGYTIGPDRSPIVAVLTRASHGAEWQEFDRVSPPPNGDTDA